MCESSIWADRFRRGKSDTFVIPSEQNILAFAQSDRTHTCGKRINAYLYEADLTELSSRCES